jgi:PAS domain S-box-containing protein
LDSAFDFRALAESSPNAYMLLDPELRYVWANAAYLKVVGRAANQILGRGLFEAFPSEGESRRQLERAVREVFAERRPTTLALIPYAIARPDGVLEHRWWTATHTPLFAPDGSVAYLLQHTADVTELQRLREAVDSASREAEQALAERDLFRHARALQEANTSLMTETARFRGLFLQAPGFIAVLRGPDHVFEFANNAYRDLVGRGDLVGRPLREALPEVVGQGFIRLLDGVLKERKAHVGRDVRVMLQRDPQRPLQERFVDFIYQPVIEADGSVSGVFVEGYDVTEAHHARERQRLLLDELNHRVKNTLASVQAIAAQTLAGSASPESFRKAFESRLMALSQTHNLLTALDDILDQELRPYLAHAIDRKGPPVDLPARAALALGMTLHELATNAAKYGALSAPEGRLTISWTLHAEHNVEKLTLRWTECDGPPVSPPTRRGFGSKLIQRSVGGELGGGVTLDFRPEGLSVELIVPLEREPEQLWTSSTAALENSAG